MKRVTGIGGIFFKARDPQQLKAWYQEHLGFTSDADGYLAFRWWELEDPTRKGYTLWEPFPQSTDYFEPTSSPFMINYRVENLDELVEMLRQEGVWIDERRGDSEHGRFAWIRDPEGNRIELWEPPKNGLYD